MQYCKKCGTENADGNKFCAKCGQSLLVSDFQEDLDNPEYDADPRSEFSMLWYDFIVYAQLFISALINAYYGITAIKGSGKGIGGRLSHGISGNDTLDIILGILMLCLAVYAIFVRQRLAHFKKHALGMYYSYLVANAMVTIVFSMGASFYSSIVFITASVIYFKERKVLFVK